MNGRPREDVAAERIQRVDERSGLHMVVAARHKRAGACVARKCPEKLRASAGVLKPFVCEMFSASIKPRVRGITRLYVEKLYCTARHMNRDTMPRSDVKSTYELSMNHGLTAHGVWWQ